VEKVEEEEGVDGVGTIQLQVDAQHKGGVVFSADMAASAMVGTEGYFINCRVLVVANCVLGSYLLSSPPAVVTAPLSFRRSATSPAIPMTKTRTEAWAAATCPLA
jgi:hypothetical protein